MTAVDDRERDDEVSDYKRERMETSYSIEHGAYRSVLTMNESKMK
jgi:hypothetical protein